VEVIGQARAGGQHAIALYVWLVAITGVRRGELCAVQVRDIDLEHGVLHVAFNYVVKGGKKVRKDTKTHQDRYIAIDPVTCALIEEHLAAVAARLAGTGVKLAPDAYLFSNQPANTRPWNPDWATHRVADLAAAAGVELNIKAMRHYTASQLLAAGFDLEIPLPGSATPAAAPPPSGTTPTRYPRSTAGPPPTSRSSRPQPSGQLPRLRHELRVAAVGEYPRTATLTVYLHDYRPACVESMWVHGWGKNVSDHTPSVNIRVPSRLWGAYGRCTARINGGRDRTEDLVRHMARLVELLGDDDDKADLAAALNELEVRRARKGGRPRKVPDSHHAARPKVAGALP
jgi:hypothetical protein